jgi:16S rRNA (guanine1516-N2)-methyltransferase|tara:strand:- start:341 stop:1075 length:735 start_codon:yes stop_codon:yes gene_type:complete
MTCVVYLEDSYKEEELKLIAQDLNFELVQEYPQEGSFISINEAGLYFIDNAKIPLDNLHIDFLSGSMGWRIKRSEHETLLKKTLGKTKDTLTIFDGTAGFLSDAIIFLSLGHKVIACEQSKILYLLVKDACNRAIEELPFLSNLTLLHGNSLEVYKEQMDIDVIYLDPLYPITKKHILRAGNISAIKNILELENIMDMADTLFTEFKELNYKKIILKRPIKGEKICSNINYQIKGKSTRFDIYI